MTTGIVAVTEQLLTWRKRRRLVRKERQKRKSVVRDWAEAILSAVLIVLLINQYLLQAYMIPSPSMVPTLLMGDRIFVNKLVYGPELIPGMAKLPGYRTPSRGDVIIFESPEYSSRGPVLDIIQRVVYMVTLSLVDIDKDELGQPKHHFLIKRAMGAPGDRVSFDQGELRILRRGETQWVGEAKIQEDLGLTWATPRIYQPTDYPGYRSQGVMAGLSKSGLPYGELPSSRSGTDSLYRDSWISRTQYAVNPANTVYRQTWRSYDAGISVGLDEILPLGDNRDNSNDGRYFGPVKLDKVLGRGLFKYWPLGRIGGIH